MCLLLAFQLSARQRIWAETSWGPLSKTPYGSFPLFFSLGNKNFRRWRDGSAANSAFSSSQGPEFSSQYPHQVAHRDLQLKIRGTWCSFLTSVGTCMFLNVHTCMHVYAHTHTHTEHTGRKREAETEIEKKRQKESLKMKKNHFKV